MKKIKNSDFVIHLPDEVAGRELGANDSVELRIYTVNADNYYKFEYEGGQVPEEQKVDASCMATMESGVLMYLLLAHIADASMPDGYFDLQEEITSDYYWIKTQEQSAQEQINELRKDILEEAEVREAADDQLSKSIDSLSEALSGAVSSMTSRLDQIDADQETQDGRISKAVDAIGDLDSRLSAENLAQDTKIQSLSGAIETERLVRDKTVHELSATHAEDIENLNQRIDQIDADQEIQDGRISKAVDAISDLDIRVTQRIQSLSGAIDTERLVRDKTVHELSATHAEDIENLNQRIDNIPQFDPSAIEGEITAVDKKVKNMGDSVSALTDHVTESKQDITALEEQMSRKADASDLQEYAPSSALTAIESDVEDLTEEVESHTQQIGNLQSTKLDASAYTPVDLSNYYTKDVIDENERVTSEELNDLNAKKLDVSAYTEFDPSVLEDYQPVSGMSGYATTQYVDNALANIDLDGYVSQEDYDSAQQATSAALNELKQTKLDSSAFTPTDLSNYYDKTEIDTMIGDYYTKDVIDENERVTSEALNDLNAKKLNSSVIANYYNKTEIDTMIGDINAALSNINGV